MIPLGGGDPTLHNLADQLHAQAHKQDLAAAHVLPAVTKTPYQPPPGMPGQVLNTPQAEHFRAQTAADAARLGGNALNPAALGRTALGTAEGVYQLLLNPVMMAGGVEDVGNLIRSMPNLARGGADILSQLPNLLRDGGAADFLRTAGQALQGEGGATNLFGLLRNTAGAAEGDEFAQATARSMEDPNYQKVFPTTGVTQGETFAEAPAAGSRTAANLTDEAWQASRAAEAEARMGVAPGREIGPYTGPPPAGPAVAPAGPMGPSTLEPNVEGLLPPEAPQAAGKTPFGGPGMAQAATPAEEEAQRSLWQKIIGTKTGAPAWRNLTAMQGGASNVFGPLGQRLLPGGVAAGVVKGLVGMASGQAAAPDPNALAGSLSQYGLPPQGIQQAMGEIQFRTQTSIAGGEDKTKAYQDAVKAVTGEILQGKFGGPAAAQQTGGFGAISPNDMLSMQAITSQRMQPYINQLQTQAAMLPSEIRGILPQLPESVRGVFAANMLGIQNLANQSAADAGIAAYAMPEAAQFQYQQQLLNQAANRLRTSGFDQALAGVASSNVLPGGTINIGGTQIPTG